MQLQVGVAGAVAGDKWLRHTRAASNFLIMQKLLFYRDYDLLVFNGTLPNLLSQVLWAPFSSLPLITLVLLHSIALSQEAQTCESPM